jgi:hypothetical protein
MKNKKQKQRIILIVIISLLILSSCWIALSYLLNKNPKECKDYSYGQCPEGCVVCPPCEACSSLVCQSKKFCESIGFNESWYQGTKSNYCTVEQKKAEVCPEYYSATCGWFNISINCIKYPCAATYSNPCFACADAKVDYYTIGECPK